MGGAEIPNDGSAWAGTWTNLAVTGGGVSLSVLPTTAVVLDLQGTPAAPGRPQLRVMNGASGVQLTVSNLTGSSSAILQASTNLVNWQSLYTNTMPYTFTDAPATSFRSRLYRAQLGP